MGEAIDRAPGLSASACRHVAIKGRHRHGAPLPERSKNESARGRRNFYLAW